MSEAQDDAPMALRATEKPADHPPPFKEKVGVLLMNLGTPSGTDYWSMRRYLSEFLSDRRVIEKSPWIWQPLLQLIILSKRPFSSGEAYRSIWNEERDESPLRTITRSQAEKLAARFADRDDVVVEWGMRYGEPSTADAIQSLFDRGARKILFLPLYPQYAAPTTATAYDKAFDKLKTMRWQPAIRTAPAYFEHPLYIQAIAASIRGALAELDFEPQLVLCPFHGLPKDYLLQGDPYHCQCQKTARLVREALGWGEERLLAVFQSRFGPDEWLQPYLDETLERLPKQGITKVAIISPGFSADCVETLEEIAIEGREAFEEAGGERFHYIPCLNDGDAQMELIEALARKELVGWL